MKKHKRSRKFNTKKLLQKYLLVMFSLALVFSPFSSLGQLAYAEGDDNAEVIQEEDKPETMSETEDTEGNDDLADKEETEDSSDESSSGEDSTSEDESKRNSESQGEPEQDEKDLDAKKEDKDQSKLKKTPSFQLFGNGNTSNATADGFEWSDNDDGTVTITGYTGNEKNITIPETIDGKTVTVIGEEAFKYKGLATVTIPATVRVIEKEAFMYNQLKSITIPQSVETIGSKAFVNNSLTEIDIPSTLKEIGQDAFFDNSLTSVNIPSTLESIGLGAFAVNPLETIEVDENNPNYLDVDGKALYTKDKEWLLQGTKSGEIEDGTKHIKRYAFRKLDLEGEFVIPSSVESIEVNAFTANKLENVVFHEGLKSIGGGSFYDNSLVMVDIPSTVNFIDVNSFQANPIERAIIRGKSVTLQPNSFSNIPGKDLTIYGYSNSGAEKYANDNNHIFRNIDEPFDWKDNGDGTVTITGYTGNDTDITIPEDILGMPVTVIDERAFIEKDLTSVTLPTNLKEIGDVAFAINELTEITIPENVESILAGPFAGNPLETIEVHKDNVHFKDIDGKGLYTEDGKTLIQGTQAGEIADETINIGLGAFAGVELDTDIHIPDAVESIGDSAFASAETLQTVKINKINKIDIPGSVKEIGDGAFVYVGLTELTLHEGLEKIGSFAFGNNDLTSIEIPSTVTAIEKDAFNFNNIDEAIFQTRNVTIDDDIFFDNQDNPADLTIYGYKDSDVESFANDEGYTFIPFPHQLPLDADEPYDFYSGEFIEIVNSNSAGDVVGTIQMPEFEQTDSLASARILIRDIDEEDVTATGLEVAGQIVDILFVGWEYDSDPENPNEDEIINDEIEGDFILSLRVNDDTSADVAIYHELGHDDWEYIGGSVEGNYITAIVTDFSKYGVFAEKDDDSDDLTDPTDPEDPKDPADPVDPKEPVDPTKPEEDTGDTEKTVKVEDDPKGKDDKKITKKGSLPKTATNSYNMLLASIFLLIIGVGIQIFVYRKNRTTQ